MVSGPQSAVAAKSRHRLAVRVLAAAVVLVLSGGQALGALHQLLVPHQICAEHGDFVHGQGEAPGLRAAGSAAEKTAVSSSPGPESHAHHDCCLTARARDEHSVLPALSVIIESAPLETRQPLDEGASSSLSSQLILLFAPKQSPPA